jgi:hypothetical protein
MTTTKEAIQEILVALDTTADTNWTEDGSPALDAIQKLAGDLTITRAQINDAHPGFARVTDAEAAKTYSEGSGGAPASQVAPAPKRSVKKPLDITEVDLTDEQMRAICIRRVREAEQHLLDAQQRVTEATMEVVHCQKRLGNAHRDHDRQFPRITPAANIKAHLEAQGRLAEENAGILSPLQAALTGRKRPVPGQVTGQANPNLPRRITAAA